MDVGNLISGSSACSKSSLYIWKFLVHILLKFMDLTFQAPMQYCSLWHRTARHTYKWVSFLLCPSHIILSGAIRNCPRLFPNSISDTFWPGGLVFWCHIFCFFIPFMKFLRREYWSGLPFPPPVDQVLSELLTMSCLSWVALHGMAHSFTDLHKPLCYVKVVNHEGENLLYTPTGMYTVAD